MMPTEKYRARRNAANIYRGQNRATTLKDDKPKQ